MFCQDDFWGCEHVSSDINDLSSHLLVTISNVNNKIYRSCPIVLIHVIRILIREMPINVKADHTFISTTPLSVGTLPSDIPTLATIGVLTSQSVLKRALSRDYLPSNSLWIVVFVCLILSVAPGSERGRCSYVISEVASAATTVICVCRINMVVSLACHTV